MCTCDEALDLIHQSIDECISETDRARLEEHLSECSSCRAVYDAYQELQAGMLELTQEVPEGFTKGTMYRIRTDGKQKVRHFAFGRASILCAAAALLLLLVGTGTLKQLGSGRSASADTAAVATAESAAAAPEEGSTEQSGATADRSYFDAPVEETEPEAELAMDDADAKSAEAYSAEADTAVSSAVDEALLYSSVLPDTESYACVLTITAPAEAFPGLTFVVCADGCFSEVTVAEAKEVAATYGETYPMEFQWNEENPSDEAAALILLSE